MKRFNKFLTLLLCIIITVSSVILPMGAASSFPESQHPYENNMDGIVTSYVYDGENADTVGGLKIHFSPETETADGNDIISIFASGNRLVGYFTENGLADKTIVVPGKAVYVSMTTNGSGTAYGYKIDSIEPLWPVTFSFETNGGSTVNSITAAYLDKEPIPEKQGLFFAGWFENSELSGDPISFPYISPASTTLYASWSDTPYINVNDFQFEINADKTNASVFKYTGTRRTVYLPTETEEGIPVTEINSAAFEKSGAVTVIINDKIKKIDSYAFSNCNTLQAIEVDPGNSVYASRDGMLYNKSMKTLLRCPGAYEGRFTVPLGVTALNAGVFDGCAFLTAVELSPGVTSIPNFAFRNCISLTETVIHTNVTSVGEQAFYGCTSLEDPKLPRTLTSIGKNAFTGSALYKNPNNWTDGILYKDLYLLASERSAVSGKVTVKERTVGIANYAFYQNTAITEVVLPGSLSAICAYSFYGCSGLTEATLPILLRYIGDYAFAKCTSLKSATVPSGVYSLGRMGLFDGCTSLESVSVGYGVSALPVNAFKNCKNLKKVTLTGNLRTVGIGAFSGCNSLDEISFLGFATQWDELKISSGNTVLDSISPTCSETSPWKKGDVNNDGKVTALDSFILKSVIVGKFHTDELVYFASDINSDGKINALDSLLQRRIILGLLNM